MATDMLPEETIKLDAVQNDEELWGDLEALEDEKQPLVYLDSSFGSWKRLQTIFCRLRASNISGMLLLRGGERQLTLQEAQVAMEFLADWDQLFLHNILQITGHWFPLVLRERLQSEVKIELKWFREWFVASTDSRIHKYPSLPWRSYIRKVTKENHGFARSLLALAADDTSINQEEKIRTLIENYLENRKQVLCIFPKRWSRGN